MIIKQDSFFRQLPGIGIPCAAFCAALFFNHAEAATVSGGALTLNLDRDALIAGVGHNGVDLENYPDTPTAEFPICCRPAIYLEEFYDTTAASKTFNQLRDDNTPDLFDGIPDEIPGIGLQFTVNGATVAANPTGRFNKATSLTFDTDDLTGTASGRIGLAGAMRFRVDVDPPSNRVLLGDLDIIYNPALEDPATGRSGWVIMNNSGFRISGFDLFDVSTQLTGNSLTLAGNLGLGHGFDHLGGITDTRVGTFSFNTTVVPLPAAFWLFVSGAMAISAAGYRKKLS